MFTPAYRLTFATKSGGSGGVLGAVTNVAQSALGAGGGGGKVIDTTEEPQVSIVTDLTVTFDLDTPADSFTLVLGNVGRFRPQRDDQVTLELGYDDDQGLTQVMQGGVVTVERGLLTIRA